MSATATSPAFCLSFDGPMTFEHRLTLEARIIDAMRRYPRLEADLSRVSDIDLYGLHLVGLLQNVGAIVALSPAVEAAGKRLLTSYHGARLGRVARQAVAPG